MLIEFLLHYLFIVNLYSLFIIKIIIIIIVVWFCTIKDVYFLQSSKFPSKRNAFDEKVVDVSVFSIQAFYTL